MIVDIADVFNVDRKFGTHFFMCFLRGALFEEKKHAVNDDVHAVQAACC